MSLRREEKRVVRRRRVIEIRIGAADGEQPKLLWDLLVWILRAVQIRFRHEQHEEYEVSTLTEGEPPVIPNEQREELTRDHVKRALETEATEHERRALSDANSPSSQRAEPAETVERLKQELRQELGAMRDEGWEIRVGDDEIDDLLRKLNMSLDELHLSARIRGLLQAARLQTVGQLVQQTEGDLLRLRGIGRKSLVEIKKSLQSIGLDMNMELPPGITVEPAD